MISYNSEWSALLIKWMLLCTSLWGTFFSLGRSQHNR